MLHRADAAPGMRQFTFSSTIRSESLHTGPSPEPVEGTRPKGAARGESARAVSLLAAAVSLLAPRAGAALHSPWLGRNRGWRGIVGFLTREFLRHQAAWTIRLYPSQSGHFQSECGRPRRGSGDSGSDAPQQNDEFCAPQTRNRTTSAIHWKIDPDGHTQCDGDRFRGGSSGCQPGFSGETIPTQCLRCRPALSKGWSPVHSPLSLRQRASTTPWPATGSALFSHSAAGRAIPSTSRWSGRSAPRGIPLLNTCHPPTGKRRRHFPLRPLGAPHFGVWMESPARTPPCRRMLASAPGARAGHGPPTMIRADGPQPSYA